MSVWRTVCIVFSITQWISLTGFVVHAAPIRWNLNETNTLFPQQKWVPPEQIKDGQSFMDKIFIMKMINYIEYNIIKNMGRFTSFPFMREYIYEGDIILTRRQVLSFVHPQTSQRRRRRKRKMDVNVIGDSHVKKWETPIEYVIDSSHTSCKEETIRSAIQHWEDQTCIKFIENNNPTGYFINFTKGSGCYSYVGKNLEQHNNPIFISDSCCTKGIIAHEIGHSLGFWHEHARQDRDGHVTTNTTNMIPGQEYNFETKSWATIDNQGVPYDISSVMHYNAVTFSMQKDSLKTLVPRDPFLQNTMGQRLGLSFYDVKLANKAYCSNNCDPADLQGQCLYDGYQDPNNCSVCRCADGLSGVLCDKVASSSDGCGGVIELGKALTSGNISSPGINNTYTAGNNCYWLIESPEGTVIKMKFVEYMNSDYCATQVSEYLPCIDYVEIRVNDSLGSTGGRFCCNNTYQRQILTDFIYTHNNHSLVIFKTTAGGRGFVLEFSFESCGGCHIDNGETQRPCFRHVTRTCYQSWVANENVTINTSITDKKPTYRIEKVKKGRNTSCAFEEPYCCDGYVLTKDNKSCILASLATTIENAPKEISTIVITTQEHVTKDSSDTENDDSMTGWSEWTSWSECTNDTCGGCGNQTRSRTYSHVTDQEKVESETRPCLEICPTGSQTRGCAIYRTYPCGFGPFTSNCTEFQGYEYQPKKCCCGFKLVKGDDEVDETCIEKT